MYREYWRLNRLHILNSIFKETNGKLGTFLKLYKQLVKERGMSIEQVVNAVEIAIYKLPYMESLYEQAKDEVDKMQSTREETENYLHTLNYEIASTKALLNSYNMLCERKRQEAENINNEMSRLEALITRFKGDDREYVKIKKTVEEEVSKFLTDGKVLLHFALASVIEAIRRNSGKYNDLIVDNASLSSVPIQQSSLQHIEDYRDMILDEANRLYDTVQNDVTSQICFVQSNKCNNGC